MKPNTMKIGINAWFLGQLTTGSGQYLTHLLEQYASHYTDHAFLLCIPNKPVERYNMPNGEWRVLHTPFDHFAGTAGYHLAKLWFEQIAFPRACRRWGADVVHVPYWASPLFCAIPVVVTVHDLIPLLLPAYQSGALGRTYIRLVSASARRATIVLTDSDASHRDIMRHLRIPAERVKAIPLAAEAHFGPLAESETARVREKYALPPAPYLLYLGGFDVRKNVPGILKAFAGLDAPHVKLVIAGRLHRQDTPFFPNPRRIAEKLGILDRIHLAGWVDEMDKPALYAGARALVFPSFYEGFGLPPLEAISCGTPAIVSNNSSLPEVAGKGALCIDAGDSEALTGAMQRIVDDQTLYEELREAGLAQAKQFSWHKTACQTVAAYERALTR